MKVIPAIDLLGGKAVRLYKGDYEQATVYNDEPLQVAQSFVSQGAQRIHVIDLDAARDASQNNHGRIEEIVHYTGVELEVGGGIRDQQSIEDLFDRGARYAILGTLAAENPDEGKRLAEAWPQRIYVSLDMRGDQVSTHGWVQTEGVGLTELLASFAEVPLAGFIYTDIERDGTMEGLDEERLLRVTSGSPHPVIVSGGISSIEHLETARRAGAEGAIVGRAIYERRINLRQAVEALAEA